MLQARITGSAPTCIMCDLGGGCQSACACRCEGFACKRGSHASLSGLVRQDWHGPSGRPQLRHRIAQKSLQRRLPLAVGEMRGTDALLAAAAVQEGHADIVVGPPLPAWGERKSRSSPPALKLPESTAALRALRTTGGHHA